MWQKIVHCIANSVHESYKLRTCCVHKLFFVLTFWTIYVHNMFWKRSELAIFMYWTGNSINNLLSYCGLVDEKLRASDIDLPAYISEHRISASFLSHRILWKCYSIWQKKCNFKGSTTQCTLEGNKLPFLRICGYVIRS